MGKEFQFDELGDIVRSQPGFGGPPPQTLTVQHYIGHTHGQIVSELTSVSDQPGLQALYERIAQHLAHRTLTPQDAAGTVITDVVHFAAGCDLIVKTMYHTMIQDWLSALFGDSPSFLAEAGKFYANVLIGTAAMEHMSPAGE
jgi:hypothetical protein